MIGWRRAAMILSLSHASSALGGVHLSLQGSYSDNKLGLRSQVSRSLSGSVGMDLGPRVRIGVTHRNTLNHTEGYVEANTYKPLYDYTRETVRVLANSLDLTYVLYLGELFMPYVQVGAVKKNFHVLASANDSPAVASSGSLPPVPSGGVGVGIRLNRSFSLKLSYTLSPGIRQQSPELKQESVWDSQTSVGLSYDI